MIDEFSTFDISRILDIPGPRLRQWIELGFVKPSIRKALGKGTKAIFSRSDLYRIDLFRGLVDQGHSRLGAGACAYGFRDEHLFNEKYLIAKRFRYRRQVWINARTGVVDENRKDAISGMLSFVKDEAELFKRIGLTGEFESVLVLNLEKTRREVDELIGD
jgi:hypothetical protein